ncbi:MAG: 5-formyltetrahydrofolate cyclo-ligase, partial [Clostridia bacterium]
NFGFDGNCHAMFSSATSDLSVCVYNALPSEVATNAIIDYYLSKCNVYLPVVVGDDIMLVRIDKDTQYSVGKWGIIEPCGQRLLPCDVQLNLCITPLLGFDNQLNRIGKGKGFYDRFFEKTNCLKVAIAYECQRLENFEVDSFDKKMDCVITQQGIYKNESN